MTPTEVFKLFLRNGVTPNERLALMTEIRAKIRDKNNLYIWRKRYYNEADKEVFEIEKIFAEQIMKNSYYISNHLGRYRDSSCCSSLSSFMRYLLFYMPSIIGTSNHKNRFLERENAEISDKVGYKRYWENRLIKKWHNFLKENITRYDRYVNPWGYSYNKWMLKDGVKL